MDHTLRTTRRALMTVLAVLSACGFFAPWNAAVAASFERHVAGRILLDVERDGRAWYVTPDAVERVYLGRPENAFRIMREHGLGITDADLAAIAPASPEPAGKDSDGDALPDAFEEAIGTNVIDTDSDDDGTPDGREIADATSPYGTGRWSADPALASRLAGKVLLQVQGRGEAWYVNPGDGRRHYLGRPADAFRVMRAAALGITAADLDRIPVAGESTKTILQQVPFTAQAPLGDWSNPRQADGCEEASALMAMHWVEGRSIDLLAAEQEIVKISDWERDNYGYYEDTSIEDTAERIFKGWYGYDGIEVKKGIGVTDVYDALAAGNLAVVAVNGRMLGNPYFRQPGPARHMALVVGYDAETGEFLVHEPGTAKGAAWRYHRLVLADALHDYDSGVSLPLPERRTAMIVVKPAE